MVALGATIHEFAGDSAISHIETRGWPADDVGLRRRTKSDHDEKEMLLMRLYSALNLPRRR
jgi:hypothetical protein